MTQKASKQVRTATPSSVRDVNRSIILNMIRLHHPISRAELSVRTGIFRSNVSGIVDDLIELGLVSEVRATPAGRGRVPFHLSLRDDGFRVVGVSIRSKRTTVTSAGLTGKPQNTIEMPTPDYPKPLVDNLCAAIEQIRESLPPKQRNFEEICVSVPGLADAAGGSIVWISSLPNYSGFPLRRQLEAAAGIPTAVDNDCNLAAMAELWLSDREDVPLTNFVYLEVGGVGLGGGIITHHEIYRGHDSTFAAEFGHMTVNPEGARCSCGRRGCWELYVTDDATWRRWRPSEEYDPARFSELLNAARGGDPAALGAIAETARILSIGISNIVFSLNPEVIVLSGRITELWELLNKSITNAFESNRVAVPLRRARMAADDLCLQGAVTVAASKAFAKPKFGF